MTEQELIDAYDAACKRYYSLVGFVRVFAPASDDEITAARETLNAARNALDAYRDAHPASELAEVAA